MQRLIYPALAGLLAFGLLATGCNEVSTDPGITTCGDNQAQLAVYDGFLETLCGCQETGGVVTPPPNPLVCTIKAGTTVFFYYQATKLLHQMVSSNSTLFQDSPVSDPTMHVPVRSFVVTFPATGTYQFQDHYNTSLNGQIIVQ